jgi:hypothetical protein
MNGLSFTDATFLLAGSATRRRDRRDLGQRCVRVLARQQPAMVRS